MQQWGHFVCRQNRENTAFEIVLQSAWRLSSLGKEVASSTPRRKRGAKFEVQKVNSALQWPAESSVLEIGRNLKKKQTKNNSLLSYVIYTPILGGI